MPAQAFNPLPHLAAKSHGPCKGLADLACACTPAEANRLDNKLAVDKAPAL